MIATQKIKRPTAVLPSLNLTQTANKCENGFFLRTIRFEIFGIKHLKLKGPSAEKANFERFESYSNQSDKRL